MPRDEASAAFARCCGSSRWAQTMTGKRPFDSAANLFAAAEETWTELDRQDWLEAFTAHPRIGDIEGLRKKYAATADWCAGEQAGVAGVGDEVLRALADGNRLYEERFGHLFLVCATGKTAAQMLDLLRARLQNGPEQEFAIAGAEQMKITRLRLEKL
jgi:2-oxo-4-hydroxy-4-carboxy-5-ureidoimidazoline decarboxylase